jgi:ATP-dependent Clp protease, protease subunit
MKRQFQAFNFQIKNASSSEVDIYIDGTIVDAETQQIYRDWYGDDTSVSYKSFRDQITAVEANTYNVYINSGGGLVTDAMAIHDLLVQLQGKGKTVNTVGRGVIASAATYILMAGKKPKMSKNSWFMIHNVSGFAWGTVNEVEQMAATLRKFNDTTRDFYADATGLSKDEIANYMNAETWFTADEAKDNGFIAEVTGEVKFTNAISKEHWQFSNTAVLNAYNSAVSTQQPEQPISFQTQIDDMKKFFQDLGTSIMNAVKGVKAPENNDHATLMAGIAEAVSTSISNAGEQMEGAVNEAADAAVASALTTAVSNAVAEAIKPFDERIQTLENANQTLTTANADLEKGITQMKGKPSNQPAPEGPAPIGGFNKK